jgi:hypothetical protein
MDMKKIKEADGQFENTVQTERMRTLFIIIQQ